MKLSTLVTIVALSTKPSLGHPSNHRHQHIHRSPAASPQDSVDTVYVYEYEGHQISAAEVQEGIANGTLVYALNGAIMPAQSVSTVSAGDSSIASPAAATVAPVAPSPAPMPSPVEKAPNQASQSPVAPSSTSSGDSSWSFEPSSEPSGPAEDPLPQGLDTDFPDGELSCSTFPSAYGALALGYLNLGGWSGIQCPSSQAAEGFADIETKLAGPCGEGDFCSYACSAGFEKTQWPTMQGSTGQSMGGIKCEGGRLRLTNPGLSKKLCSPGSTEVAVTVHNTMSDTAAICRTDYPGTESETIPLQAEPGTISNLTCPNAAHYYNWQGKSTSAQYYVNPKGMSTHQACQWGKPGDNFGNYAPVNLGVGYSNGAAWLSIFQNKPTTDANLDFSIEIVGDDGGFDNLVGRCKYENGQFCSGDNYSQTSSDGNGCTVSVSHGSATFVLSP